MRILVTGAAGFIGSNFVRLALQRLPDAKLVVIDALTYAGNLSTLADVRDKIAFYPGKIQDPTVVEGIIKAESITHIVNFAAESHNDRSILEAGSFIQTDVLGTYVLLEATRNFKLEKMVHVSTDEVYGSIDSGHFTEDSPIQPNTPYSASKAGGDLQVRSHVKAFGTPAVITRGGNTYGPYQFPEKLIPFFTVRLLDGKKVPVYGEGNQVREWIHAMDHASGVLSALLKGEPGQIYNVGDVNERPNSEVVKILLEETGRDESLVKKIPDPRKGAHDKRYSMKADKMRGLGWAPEYPFEESLRKTVRWYKENEAWWRPLIETEDFQAFVKRFYGPSLGEDL
ncbi:MAG: dTDP-glucose 4,6-dehydratase [Fimbriimonadaceae bacterium]|nr:dTDP-glucose 4,6-dehydratase [Fimbriimonadaceae bacterium]